MERLGDVQLNKKMHMTQDEKETLKKQEREAIEFICGLPFYPKTLNGFLYRELLYEAIAEGSEKSAEAQLAKLADKLDCFGECAHEMISGNISLFERPMKNCISYLTSFQEQYPEIAPLWIHCPEHAAFSVPRMITEKDMVIPQTETTVRSRSGILMYDLWKAITINNWGIDYLVQKREGEYIRSII
jgi:hypothetical protein